MTTQQPGTYRPSDNSPVAMADAKAVWVSLPAKRCSGRLASTTASSTTRSWPKKFRSDQAFGPANGSTSRSVTFSGECRMSACAVGSPCCRPCACGRTGTSAMASVSRGSRHSVDPLLTTSRWQLPRSGSIATGTSEQCSRRTVDDRRSPLRSRPNGERRPSVGETRSSAPSVRRASSNCPPRVSAISAIDDRSTPWSNDRRPPVSTDRHERTR